MDFLNLPIEIGSKIFDLLDTKTRINVYNSCHELRDYFRTWCRLKTVNLSRSTLAVAKTIKQMIFSDLGHHILDLNLSGIPDLTVDNLKPYIKQFVNLKALDVTFTKIYLLDIPDICPENLKSIGINFFIKSDSRDLRIPIETKNVFREKQFEVVHFVVTQLGLSAAPLIFIKDLPITIKDLKLTLADNYKDFMSLYNEEINSNGFNLIDVNFNKLTVVARDCAVTHKFSKELDGVSRLNFEHLEYIFMMYLERIEIYVSPLLAKLFTVCCHDLTIKVSQYLPLNFMLDGNIVFKAWNKNTTNFDHEFYKKLLFELKDYLPTYYCMHANCMMKISEAYSTWFCIDEIENIDRISELPDKVTLNNLCRKGGLLMKCRYPISLSQSLKMQNLTFLTINNIPIRKEFFTLLFESCPKLVTLVLYSFQGMVRSYIRSLTKSIHLAKLRNFMLTSENIKYNSIFGILSRCSSLENIHICEYERELSDKYIDSRNISRFIENCEDLYSLFIEADMSAEDLTLMMAPAQATAHILSRDHLCIEVCSLNWSWNPFADVFSPSPLHIFN